MCTAYRLDTDLDILGKIGIKIFEVLSEIGTKEILTHGWSKISRICQSNEIIAPIMSICPKECSSKMKFMLLYIYEKKSTESGPTLQSNLNKKHFLSITVPRF